MLAQPYIALNSLDLMEMQPKTVMQLNATEQHNANPPDPLIASGLHKEQYIGLGVLAILVILAVGLISRKIEHAIAFSLILSLILIVFGFLV